MLSPTDLASAGRVAGVPEKREHVGRPDGDDGMVGVEILRADGGLGGRPVVERVAGGLAGEGVVVDGQARAVSFQELLSPVAVAGPAPVRQPAGVRVRGAW